MMDRPDAHPDMGADPAPVTWARLLEDWVTIWQSEMAALAVDREVREAMVRTADTWAAQARMAAGVWAPMLQSPALQIPALQTADERAPGRTAADAPAGATAAAAAPDGRDAVIDRLLRRVAELERRLGPPSPAGGDG